MGQYKVFFQIEENGGLTLDLGNPKGAIPPDEILSAQIEFLTAINGTLERISEGNGLGLEFLIEAYGRFNDVLTKHGYVGLKWIDAHPNGGGPFLTGHFLFRK